MSHFASAMTTSAGNTVPKWNSRITDILAQLNP